MEELNNNIDQLCKTIELNAYEIAIAVSEAFATKEEVTNELKRLLKLRKGVE